MRKYIINQVSAQDEQRQVKKNYITLVPYICGTLKENNPKQIPPNQDSSPKLKSERHPTYSRLPELSAFYQSNPKNSHN
jgi:hypothetical protein